MLETNRNCLAVPVSHFRGSGHPRSAQWRPFWRPSIVDHGWRVFIAAPQAWNQLPADIGHAATYSTFKHNLNLKSIFMMIQW